MKCERCGKRIRKADYDGRSDAGVPCDKAAAWGLSAWEPCRSGFSHPAVSTTPSSYNPDVSRLAKKRGKRKQYRCNAHVMGHFTMTDKTHEAISSFEASKHGGVI